VDERQSTFGLDASEPGEPTSADLLRRARDGDAGAADALFARHLRPLQRWARGRLPRWARGIADTADIVQDVMVHAFSRLHAVDLRRKGALQAYLRVAIQNRIKDEFRAIARRAPHDPLDTDIPDRAPSPLALAVDAEKAEQYTRALKQLRPADQELIVGRIELGYSYEQLALALGRPSAESARVAVRRAFVRLADEMTRA
jgi:RNA polymerase sigma factor (sigma-70 family)